MGLLRDFLGSSKLRRRKGRGAEQHGHAVDVLRRCRFERMEPRQMMAADIQLGMVYYEPGTGKDEQPNVLELTWSGGAPDTELVRLVIETDKEGNGLTIGDTFFDTAAGGTGAFASRPFHLVDGVPGANQGLTLTSVQAVDGSTTMVLTFSGFTADKRLLFTIDVDEQGFLGPNAVAEGNEFEGSQLTATFSAPHYHDATKSDIFFDKFDDQLAASGLALPADDYAPPNALPSPVLTAGAFLEIGQSPLPITLSGTVFEDHNLNNSQEAGDQGIAGVELSLWRLDGGNYVNTGQSAVTGPQGQYRFENVLPGEYRIVEAQPENYFSIGAKAGTVDGAPRGAVTSADIISQIQLLGGQDSVHNDFAEARPARLSGRVYHDANDNGVLDPGEQGISGATLRVQRDLGGGNFGPETTAVSDANGDWSVEGLAPGTYLVVEVQPVGYLDGRDSAGTAGGNAVNPGDEIGGIFLASGEDGREYNFGEIVPGSIHGLVHADADGDCLLDPGETPLAGVTIQLLNPSGSVIATTATDSQGQYVFLGLAPGTYSVHEVQPAGYFDGDDMVGSAGGSLVGPDTIAGIVLVSGARAVDYNFCEHEPVSIAGRVYVDGNNNGLVDSGETGISGAALSLLDASGAPTGQTATTDAQGNYRFEGLAPGVYGVAEAQPEGYFDGLDTAGSAGGAAQNPGDRITGAQLGPGMQGVDYNFGELRPASIGGLVHADADGDCILDPGETPLAGVVIQLLSPGGTLLYTTTTNAEGRYRFDNLPPGAYSVREIQPAGYFDSGDMVGSAGGSLVAPDTIASVVLGSGVSAVEYNFCELESVGLSGKVYVDDNNNGLVDSGEVGIFGVTLVLLDVSVGATGLTTTTDSLGDYRFEGLAPGVYGVAESQPGGYFDGLDTPGSAGGTAQNPGDRITGVSLAPGSRATGYNFGELRPAALGGHVYVDSNQNSRLDPGETLLAGARVHLLDAAGQTIGSSVTDQFGHYRFDGLAPGLYGIREQQPSGYFDGGDQIGSVGGFLADNDLITEIALGSGTEAIDYDFAEIPPGTISGYVFQDGPAIEVDAADRDRTIRLDSLGPDHDGRRTPDDRPISAVRLRLADATGRVVLDARGELIETVTGGDGFYQFTGLPPGLYTVIEVQPSGYQDGINTAGTAGGIVLNPGLAAADGGLLPIVSIFDVVGRDAIAHVPLAVGQLSTENNFGEIVVTSPQFRGFPPVLVLPPPFAPGPVAARIPPTQLVTPPFLPATPPIDYYGDGYVSGFTWHLSVINAGRPRGERVPEESLARLISNQPDAFREMRSELGHSRWRLDRGAKAARTARDVVFGMHGGIPVTGDFNGDGITDVGVYLRGMWFIDLNGNGVWDSEDLWARLGHDGDLPVTGDWDGDGKTDIGIFGRAWAGDPQALAAEPGLPAAFSVSTGATKNIPPTPREATLGKRTMQRTAQGQLRSDLIDHVFHYGTPGDFPVAGDWDGDGTHTIGIFRDGVWKLDIDGDGQWSARDQTVHFGQPGDRPVVGDFNGDGIDELGVYRHGTWLIDANGNGRFDEKDEQHELGGPDDTPVLGDWNGEGRDRIGIYRDGQSEPTTL